MRAGGRGREPAVDPVDEDGVAGGQVAVTDASAAGQQVEGKRLRGEAEVAADGFEVAGGVGGDLLEPFHDRLPVALVGGEGGGPVVRGGHERLGQGDGVVQGQAGPRPDREVGRVGGVTDQHDVLIAGPAVPRPVADGDERPPDGFVRQQPVAAEIGGEQFLAEGQAVGLAHRVEPRGAPGRLRGLDDEGAAVGVVGIGVDLEEAVRRRREDEGEDSQGEVGAEPDVLAGGGGEAAAEGGGVGRSQDRPHPVGGHHQVAPGERPQRVVVGNLGGESQVGAERRRPVRQQSQQGPAGDGGEAVAGRADQLPGVVDVDRAPPDEGGVDLQIRLVVGVAQVGQGLVGEDDAPAVGDPGRVAFPQDHLMPGPAQEDGQEEPARPAPADPDPHDTVLTTRPHEPGLR